MKAVTFHDRRDVRVDEVPDPVIEEPTDAIVRITSTAICGSDLHLYEVLSMFLDEGEILGHEPMGTVEEVGGQVNGLRAGDRVVIPFNARDGRRRSARGRRSRDPSDASGAGPAGLRDVPEEAGRRDQGRARALAAVS